MFSLLLKELIFEFYLRILVDVYLMLVVYRTKGLKYNLFYLCVGVGVCVCVCVCVCVFLAVVQCILFSYYIYRQQSSYKLSRSCSQNIYDTGTFTFTVL